MQSATGLQRFRQSKMFTLLIMLAIIVILFTVWAAAIGNHFFSLDVLITIVNSLVVTSFLALGAAFLMVTGNIDLSASTSGAFGGMLLAASVYYWHFPWYAAILFGLAACAAFGAFNAVLVNEFHFQPFIATMAMSYVIRGAMMLVSVDWSAAQPTATSISFTNRALEWIGSYTFFGKIPFTILLSILAFIIYGIILSKSEFGMKMYLCGGNPFAARLSGINPKKISYILFINCAVMGGISGMVLACRTKQATILALQADMFTGMTAAMLGGISFGGGSGGMGGAFVGLLILKSFSQGMMTVNFSPYWTTVLSGLLLILALTIDFIGQKNRRV